MFYPTVLVEREPGVLHTAAKGRGASCVVPTDSQFAARMRRERHKPSRRPPPSAGVVFDHYGGLCEQRGQ